MKQAPLTTIYYQIKSNWFWIYPFLFVFGIGLFIFFLPFHFIPDYFNIKIYSKTYELFSLIIRSLVSLIAIYITVTKIAYEFFKQKSGMDFHKFYLINRHSAKYISLSVATIIFTFICSILISNINPNFNEITLIYYDAFLFIAVIALLIPVSFKLFDSLRPEKYAKTELNKINTETIFITVSDNDDIDKEVEIFENHPLVQIENIVIALIADSDNYKAQAIIQNTTLKLANLIIDQKNFQDKEYIIQALAGFLIKIIDFSLSKPNNSQILEGIWVAIDEMYSLIIKRKESAEHYDKFRKEFFPRYFNRLLESKKEELVFEGITTLRLIIQKQVLFNMVEDNKIYYINILRNSIEQDFKVPENYSIEDLKNAHHWEEITIETMQCFDFLINKAINLNQPDLLNKCFEQLNKLNYKFHLKEVSIYKRHFFYVGISKTICDNTYAAFKKNVFLEGHDAQYLVPFLFENLIEEKHPASRTVLQNYCNLLIKLQKINKLDRWFLGGLCIGDVVIIKGELGQIAENCAFNFDKGEEIQGCLEDCIDTFAILKDYYEKTPPDDFGFYLVIKSRLEDILKRVESKPESEAVVIRLKGLIESFKNKNSS